MIFRIEQCPAITAPAVLRSRFQYSGSMVYNNFPWPTRTADQPERVEEKARAVLAAREPHLPPPRPTVVELANGMKTFSFLNVHCKYIVYLNRECEPFLRPSRFISWSSSKRCGPVSAILLSSLATECDRKILRASGN
jgi:hypothetical protein